MLNICTWLKEKVKGVVGEKYRLGRGSDQKHGWRQMRAAPAGQSEPTLGGKWGGACPRPVPEPPAQPRGEEAASLVFSQIEAKKRGKH